MAYDLFPGVDATYNFPPEVIAALVQNPSMRNTVIPMTQTVRNNLTGSGLWDGRLVLNTDTDRVNRYDLGTASWFILAEIADTLEPAGIIKMFGGLIAPAAHVICDGTTLPRLGAGSRLFDAIGTTFNIGGEAVTDFRLPNFKGKIPVGRDVGQTEFDVMGETGGEKTHLLTVAEEPSHAHGATTGYDGGVDHLHTFGTSGGGGAHQHWTGSYARAAYAGGGLTARDWDGRAGPDITTSQGGHDHTGTTNAMDRTPAHWHTTTIGATGGGTAHNNLQPYIVINYIITL
jgi:microcystin-dependent protein